MLRWLTAPWRGQQPLWKVAVLFVPITGVIIFFVPWSLTFVGVSSTSTIFIGWFALLLVYIVWSVVSLWRSTRRSRPGEERWVTLGQTGNGPLLVVVHTYQQTSATEAAVRILSARRATQHEQQDYEQN